MFEHAAWFIQRREHEAMFGSGPLEFGYDPAHYGGLRQAKIEQVDGDHDVFGDDSVRMISTPGHTPGHCSQLVRLPTAGPIILSGDIAHYRYNIGAYDRDSARAARSRAAAPEGETVVARGGEGELLPEFGDPETRKASPAASLAVRAVAPAIDLFKRLL
jgi:glyoxylase-like metal-dependent hydrolase (beta-lactamase superfamily II)